MHFDEIGARFLALPAHFRQSGTKNRPTQVIYTGHEVSRLRARFFGGICPPGAQLMLLESGRTQLYSSTVNSSSL
jgi:hypothetical protein